jgi:hypothetical protein
MPAAYVEHRPLSTSEHTDVSHYVIVINGSEVHGSFQTQSAAKDFACKFGYRSVHVARHRHLRNRDQPDHWRSDPC